MDFGPYLYNLLAAAIAYPSLLPGLCFSLDHINISNQNPCTQTHNVLFFLWGIVQGMVLQSNESER